MSFVDTHAHLPLLEHDSVEAILERSQQAKVDTLVTVSTESSNWESNRDLAEKFPNVYFSIGLHPHQANQWIQCATLLTQFFPDQRPHDKCVAIGETGLDFYYDFCPKDLQITSLEAQIAWAKKMQLPLIIHCREAFAELFECFDRTGLPTRPGVMHCFTGTEPDAFAAVDLGFKISFSGILTFKNADPLRDVARKLPLSEIVLETDCPYLAPLPFRGKPNEPSFLPYTAKVLADVRGISVEEVAEQTSLNAGKLFGWGSP